MEDRDARAGVDLSDRGVEDRDDARASVEERDDDCEERAVAAEANPAPRPRRSEADRVGGLPSGGIGGAIPSTSSTSVATATEEARGRALPPPALEAAAGAPSEGGGGGLGAGKEGRRSPSRP